MRAYQSTQVVPSLPGVIAAVHCAPFQPPPSPETASAAAANTNHTNKQTNNNKTIVIYNKLKTNKTINDKQTYSKPTLLTKYIKMYVNKLKTPNKNKSIWLFIVYTVSVSTVNHDIACDGHMTYHVIVTQCNV